MTRVALGSILLLTIAACGDESGPLAPDRPRPTASIVAPHGYVATELGTLPGGTGSRAWALNDVGQVAGESRTGSGENHAFVWSARTGMRDLGTLGGTISVARGINNQGAVVGFSTVPDGSRHAFLWTAADGMQDLGTLGGTQSFAYSINARGDVVGQIVMADGSPRAFLKPAGGAMRELGTFGGVNSTAFAINNHGDIAVTRDVGAMFSTAFLYSNGNFTDLGNLGGTGPADGAVAWALNEHRDVVGESIDASERAIGFFWSASRGISALGALSGTGSAALAINNRGQVAGLISAPAGPHAFVWTARDGMVDLTATDGMQFGVARAINDRGQVAGYAGTANGVRAILWSTGSASDDGVTALQRPGVHRNGERYSDLGQHPTTGRSGSAALTIRALLGRDHMTTLDVSTGAVDGGSESGTIAKTQVKAFDPNGLLVWTQNFTPTDASGSATYAFPGRGRNSTLQVQGNVRGLDGARTDVVTVSAPVKLRPDLRGDSVLYAPPRASLNAPVVIGIPVSEINGDVGARADCVLYVDGARVDAASGIWVDASNMVSCQFAWTFRTIGAHQVQVRVENVTPGDYDERNNASPIETIEVTAPGLFYYASAAELTRELLNENLDSWRTLDGTRGQEYSNDQTLFEQAEYASLWAQGDVAIDFPLARLSYSQSTGGVLVDAADAANVYPTYQYDDGQSGWACVYSGNNGVFFSLCNQWYMSGGQRVPSSSISYFRSSGVVTYFSSIYYHYWDQTAPVDYVYVYNGPAGGYSYGPPSVPFGDDYQMHVHVEGSAGTFDIDPTIALLPYGYSFDSGRSCWDYSYADITGRQCSRYSGSESGRAGTAQGFAFPRMTAMR